MERHHGSVQQALVHDEPHLVLRIVHLGEEGEMALLHAQHGLQQLVVCKAQRTALVLQVLPIIAIYNSTIELFKIGRTISHSHTLVSFFMSTVVS